MTYKKWIMEWLTDVKTKTKERTYQRYYEISQQHIIPLLGDYDINQIDYTIIQGFLFEKQRKGNLKNDKPLSINTLNLIITVLKSSLKSAFTCGIASNPIYEKCIRYKIIEKRIHCFSVKEQIIIEQYIDDNSKTNKLYGIIICLYTGIRIGELLALTWNDIDFENRIIFINKSCHDKRIDGKTLRVVETPKTLASNRIIPIPYNIVNMLLKMRQNSTSQYVICDNKGQWVLHRSYQKTFEQLQIKLGITQRGFHSLRHTFATRGLESGMDVKTLSEILGHNDPTITLKRYAHCMLEHKRNSINKLAEIMEKHKLK